MAFLEAHGIVKSYPVGGRSLTVLRDLDLQVEGGEMVAIVGASGVGKSTLLHVLGGLDRVDQGTVVVDGPRAEELLRRVGLGERLTHRPGMLSGGEQQRVAVARALVMQPLVLLADEPTGDLDEQTADTLHALLREMHQAYGLTSVIATHNPRLAAACDRTLRLEGGRLTPAGGLS